MVGNPDSGRELKTPSVFRIASLIYKSVTRAHLREREIVVFRSVHGIATIALQQRSQNPYSQVCAQVLQVAGFPVGDFGMRAFV